MQVQITARHFKLTDPLRAHIEERVGKLVRYYDGITTVHVVLELGQANVDERSAEIAVGVYRQTLTCRETADKHEDAVNQCVANLKRQLLRYKDKLRGKHKYNNTPTVPPQEAAEAIEALPDLSE